MKSDINTCACSIQSVLKDKVVYYAYLQKSTFKQHIMAGVPGIIDLIKFPYSIILFSLFTEENGMKASHVHSFYKGLLKDWLSNSFYQI